MYVSTIVDFPFCFDTVAVDGDAEKWREPENTSQNVIPMVDV